MPIKDQHLEQKNLFLRANVWMEIISYGRHKRTCGNVNCLVFHVCIVSRWTTNYDLCKQINFHLIGTLFCLFEHLCFVVEHPSFNIHRAQSHSLVLVQSSHHHCYQVWKPGTTVCHHCFMMTSNKPKQCAGLIIGETAEVQHKTPSFRSEVSDKLQLLYIIALIWQTNKSAKLHYIH